MQNNSLPIKSNQGLTIEAKEALVNAYGFDLSEENIIGYSTGKLSFKIMGFKASNQFDTLIATVKVSLNPHLQDIQTHTQKIDLYNHDKVNSYCRTSAFQLNVNEAEIKNALCALREKLEKYRLSELKNVDGVPERFFVSEKEQKDAIAVLKADNLMECIEGLLKEAGVITETENALKLFLILLSRHFDKPLHILFQGSPQLSRMLMDAVSSSLPEEHIHQQTSMSASSLYYTRTKGYWKNKVLYLKSIDRQFKGASTIKEFIDNKVLKRHTIESDYQTRQLYASNKVVDGPICLMGYSDDESLNNKFFQECFFIRVEENEKNKADIFNYLKKECGGLIDIQVQQQAIRQLIIIQRLIKPVKVIIPYAMELELPEKVLQPLRSLPQLLTFIKSVALLHQHQLPKKTNAHGQEYIEANTEHLSTAIELIKSIVISQGDILTQSQRSFLERLKNYVKDEANSFKIPDVLKALQMSSSSFYREFNALKAQGYFMQSGGNRKKGVEYRITEWADFRRLQANADSWNEQLSKIKSDVSQKFPNKFSKAKNQIKQVIQTK